MTGERETSDFLFEADSQAAALAELIEFYRRDDDGLLVRWRELAATHSGPVFVGMGTSRIAPLLVADVFGGEGGIDAGEFVHYRLDDPDRGALYVLVSQSGESVETRRAAESLADAGCPTAAIVNDTGSTMARRAGLALPMLAGEEKSISNKTYLNTLALLHLLAGGSFGPLEEAAAALAEPVDRDSVQRAAEHLAPADSVHFIARGPSLAAAHQCALTFMEGAKTHGRAFSGGEFRHGPYEVLGPDHRAVVLAPRGRTSELSLKMAGEMAEAGGRVVLITDVEDVRPRENLAVLRAAATGTERMFPLAIARLQCHLLHHVARLRGYEAGKFDRVSKVTEVE